MSEGIVTLPISLPGTGRDVRRRFLSSDGTPNGQLSELDADGHGATDWDTQVLTRPATAQTMVSGRLIGGITANYLHFTGARVAGKGGRCIGMVMKRSSPVYQSVVVRAHVFAAQPVLAFDDFGAFLPVGDCGWKGFIDVEFSSQIAAVVNGPATGAMGCGQASNLPWLPYKSEFWVALEARGSFASPASESFSVTPLFDQD